MSPIRGTVVLPADCSDFANFEWEESKPTSPTVTLPAPVEVKSLAESFNNLVLKVREYQRPVNNPLAAAIFVQ